MLFPSLHFPDVVDYPIESSCGVMRMDDGKRGALEMFKDLSERLSKVKKERESIKDEVVEVLKNEEDEKFELEDGGRIKLIRQKRRIFKLAEFREEHPDLFEMFSEEREIVFPRYFPEEKGRVRSDRIPALNGRG